MRKKNKKKNKKKKMAMMKKLKLALLPRKTQAIAIINLYDDNINNNTLRQ